MEDIDKSWMDKPLYTTTKNLEKSNIPKGFWEKCPNCNTQQSSSKLGKNLYVCNQCDFHLFMPIEDRISMLCDKGSYKQILNQYQSVDPLNFSDGITTYPEKVKISQKKTGYKEAVVTGKATINHHPIVIAIMDFKFIGGSMGSVVGEKIYQAMQVAIKTKSAFITIASSGGARMQEGLISLMQMAKTCIGVEEMSERKIPYISIITNPTMGGVTASFATVADIIIAEPKASIGFAGKRVIEDTIKEKLPENFQTAEYLYERGFIDMIVPRKELKTKLTKVIELLSVK